MATGAGLVGRPTAAAATGHAAAPAPSSRDLWLLAVHFGCSWAALSLSAARHRTLEEWFRDSPWAAFLSWNITFYAWYLLVNACNWWFLGGLRPFERRRWRRVKITRFSDTLVLVFTTAGLDLTEALCWLLWATPFTLARVGLAAIIERASSVGSELPSTEDDAAGGAVGSAGAPVRSDVPPVANLSRPPRGATHRSSGADRKEEGPLRRRSARSRLRWPFPARDRVPPASGSRHAAAQLTCALRVLRGGVGWLAQRRRRRRRPTLLLAAYLLLLFLLCAAWTVVGLAVFRPRTTWGTWLLILYDPAMFVLWWPAVWALLLAPASETTFVLTWTTNLAASALATARLVAGFAAVNRYLFVSGGDLLLFYKLRECCASQLRAVRKLTVFVQLRKLLPLATAPESQTPELQAAKPSAAAPGAPPSGAPPAEAPPAAPPPAAPPLCVVCREDICARSLKLRNCGHELHRDCMLRCLERSVLCPICREPCLTQSDIRKVLDSGNCLVRTVRRLLVAEAIPALHAEDGA